MPQLEPTPAPLNVGSVQAPPQSIAKGSAVKPAPTTALSQQPMSPRREYRPKGIDKYNVASYEPNCCCPYHTPEHAGYVFGGSLPIAATVMSNLFMSAAILELAHKEAGCGYLFTDDVDDDPPRCTGKVYGMHPANIYVVTATVAAVLIAIVNPFIGAIIDHTRFRKHIAVGSLTLLAVIQFIQISISRKTWFFVTLLQVPAIAAYVTYQTAFSSYLPEQSPSLADLNTLSAASTKYLFIAEVSYVVFVAAVATVLFGGGTVETCRLSQALCGIILVYCVIHVFGRLLRTRRRPKLPLCEAFGLGMHSLKLTVKEMAVDFPMVRRYLISVMFIESAMNTFSSVAAVYLVSQLGATGTEFALVILTLLITGAIFSPIADKVSKWSAEKYGDDLSGKPALCGSVLWIAVVTCFAPVLMQDRADLPLAFVFALFWGIGMGFYYSYAKPVYFFIIPGGQESKFSGLYTFFQLIIGWAPLLAFSIFLSITGSLAGGFIIMAVFLLIGLMFLVNVDMKRAREDVLKSDSLKYRVKPTVEDEDAIVDETDEKGEGMGL